MKKQTLQERYNDLIDEYVKKFERKHELELDSWVSDDKKGIAKIDIAYFGDIIYLNVTDIMYDINNKLPQGLITDWIVDSVEYSEGKGQYLNLHSYWKGLRYQDLPDAVI